MSFQEDFIRQIAPAAVEIQKQFGLPAVALVGQICQETGYGQSVTKDMYIGKYSYNLFNLKGVGPAGSVSAKTKEFVNGAWVTVLAKFRAYINYEQSFYDYVHLILKNYPHAKSQKNPYNYIRGLKQDGYATDPDYVQNISWIINHFGIDKIVKEVLAVNNESQPSPWAVESIKKVEVAGIMVGDANGDFRPKDPVTREELAVVIAKVAKL